MRKILYTSSYGAGWSSWCGDYNVAKYMATYQPIIDAIEKGESLSEEHPAVLQLKADVKEKFNKDYICVAGAENLEIFETEYIVRIEGNAGRETVYELFDCF